MNLRKTILSVLAVLAPTAHIARGDWKYDFPANVIPPGGPWFNCYFSHEATVTNLGKGAGAVAPPNFKSCWWTTNPNPFAIEDPWTLIIKNPPPAGGDARVNYYLVPDVDAITGYPPNAAPQLVGASLEVGAVSYSASTIGMINATDVPMHSEVPLMGGFMAPGASGVVPFATFTGTPVPEPATAALMSLAPLAFGASQMRRRLRF